MPVILVTQDTEIRTIVAQSQPRQIVHETLSWKKPNTKKGWCSGSRCRSWVLIPAPQKKKIQGISLQVQNHIASSYTEITELYVCMWVYGCVLIDTEEMSLGERLSSQEHWPTHTAVTVSQNSYLDLMTCKDLSNEVLFLSDRRTHRG
jgi:hypothetical protein